MFSVRFTSVLSVLLMVLIAPPFLNSHEKVVVIPLNIDPPPAEIYTWQEQPANIPDKGHLFATITVPPSAGKIVDLNVYIFIEHTWNADLRVYLSFFGSDGTYKERALFIDDGYSDDGFYIILNDEAATAIGDVPNDPNDRPVTGNYKPSSALSYFDSEDASGNWTLIIYDEAVGDSGRLVSWSLQLWNPGSIL